MENKVLLQLFITIGDTNSNQNIYKPFSRLNIMDSFIKKIFEGNAKEDMLVHQQFQKFSKGEFKGRALIVGKNSKGIFSIGTTAEYAKDLIIAFAEKLGNEKTHVTGALISALDLTGFDYVEKKSTIGVRKYIIDSEMSGNEILDLCKKVSKAFFGLSFSFGNSELKIQPKSPKSAKGVSSAKKEGEKLKADFCKLKTSDKSVIEGLIFESEASEFKKIEISHEFIVQDIVIPNELKSEKDFAIIREKSLRKGKIIRKLNVDGKNIIKEKEFEA